MIDIFFIIIVVIPITLFFGLLYLIYHFFKIRLKKSGRLTGRLNKQVNQIFVLSFCLIIVMLYCFKDYRIPSKDRLEKAADVKLPKGFKVTKDEYQDMWQDYNISYTIQFDNAKELVKNIKQSKFYNPNVKSNSIIYDSLYINIDNEKAIWYKSETGYVFRRNAPASYLIKFDTLTNILRYSEVLF